MLDSGLLQTFSINRDRLTELIEAPSSIDRDMSTSTEPIWNRNCEGSSHAKILQVTPEYSLSQLKPSLAGVQSKRSSGVMSGSIPHVASSSTLRNTGGASNLDLTSLNESALDLSFRLPAFESRSDQNSTTFILEQFWREIRDDLLYLEDDVLDEDSPSSYAGLTIGVVDQDAGQLIFEYDFVGDFPTSGQDWSIIHGEQGTNKMKTLVVNVSFPDKYPNRDLQPIISVTVQNVSYS